jgi:acetyltransferase-like isoleucine patch superfamily enzyme
MIKHLLKIIYKKRILFRQKYYSYFVRKQAQRVGYNLKVNGKSRVNSQTILGNNVNFNGMIITGLGKVTIGNNFHSGPGCIIINSYHNYDGGTEIPYDSTYIHKDVVIEDNVWLGTNVTVLGGVTIGEGAIIQIGSVVVSSIPPCAIAGGHPAKVYKYRDKEHYYKLKAEGKFH